MKNEILKKNKNQQSHNLVHCINVMLCPCSKTFSPTIHDTSECLCLNKISSKFLSFPDYWNVWVNKTVSDSMKNICLTPAAGGELHLPVRGHWHDTRRNFAKWAAYQWNWRILENMLYLQRWEILLDYSNTIW